MSTRAYNFSAGPGMLPLPVLEQVQRDIVDWGDRGVSIIEVSHRSKPFGLIMDSLRERIRRLLSVPATHEILFCAGGAASQFAAIPLNLAAKQSGAYVVSGHWSRKALKQAQRFTNPAVVTDNQDLSGLSMAPVGEWSFPKDAAYLCYTDNETVNGLLLPSLPKMPYPVVCDMTSSLFTGEVDWSSHDLVVASAQKNIGPAGITLLIIRRDLCDRETMPQTPIPLSYAELLKADSMPNTPCTFALYVCELVCQWMEDEGGVSEMSRRREERSKVMYDVIDSDPLYTSNLDPSYRSSINVVFQLADESLQDTFLGQAKHAGFHALKGHRVVGGCRASMYNAMPVKGAYALADFMRDFSKRHG